MVTLSDILGVKQFDMAQCFSRAIDFLHPRIFEHHLRVAYIAAWVGVYAM